MPILFPELKGKSQSGLYAISPQKPSNKETDFKMGRTVNFTNRLNGYHICWNKGFFIYALLPIRPSLFSSPTCTIWLCILVSSSSPSSTLEINGSSHFVSGSHSMSLNATCCLVFLSTKSCIPCWHSA